MGNKKGLLITLIIIIVILIVAIGGFAYAFVATDFLKSNEQLFGKYIAETGLSLKNFQSEALGAYIDRTKQMPYESEGKLTVKVDMPNVNKEYLDLVNGVNITYTGKTDSKNKQVEQNIKLNYSEDVAFPLTYRQTGDLYGIISDILIKKYIAIENRQTEELFDKLGMPVEIKIDTLDTMNANAIVNELAKCKEILKANITKENFSKTGNDAYTLTISDSRVVTNIINELENSSFLPKEIGDSIEEELASKTIKITVNKSNQVTLEIVDMMIMEIQVLDNRIMIIPKIQNAEENMSIAIQKSEVGNQLSYEIIYDIVGEAESSSVTLGMQYTNLEGQTVKENYTLGLAIRDDEQSVSYDYTIASSKKFVNKVDVEELTSENAVILNDQTEEYIGKLLETLVTAVGQVNAVQMGQLGLQAEQNPLIYATPLGIMLLSINNSLNGGITGNDVNQAINDTEEAMAFNAGFESYQGMQTASVVQSLVQKVITNNENNPEHIIGINGISDKGLLTSYSAGLNVTQTYNVILNKDAETGYINTINIV